MYRATAPRSSAAPLIAETASGLESSSRGRSSGVERSRDMTWNTTPATTVTVGSHRATPWRGPGGVYSSTSARKTNHQTQLVSPSVAKSLQAGTSCTPTRPSSEYSSQNALQARAVPSPRNAHPARCSGARPVTTTPTNQQATIAAFAGNTASPTDDPMPSGRARSEASAPSISAGTSGQVTTLARTRLAGCMWPSWQQQASPHSGSALIRGPVTARSCRTCPDADAGDPASATHQGAAHVPHPGPDRRRAMSRPARWPRKWPPSPRRFSQSRSS